MPGRLLLAALILAGLFTAAPERVVAACRLGKLVRLRMGELDRAIDDYGAALELRPRSAASLYGRGLAELRKGMTTQAEADIAAATAMRPTVGDELNKHGVTP